jgi:hypothetical protein
MSNVDPMVSRIREAAVAASCVILTFVTGCSVLAVATGDQCKVDDDCAARGGDFAGLICVDRVCVPPSDAGTTPMLPPGWECVGTLKPETPRKPQVTVYVSLTDLIRPENSVSDAVLVRACRKLDVGCAMPYGAPIHPEANGQAKFVVDGGFDGYVEVIPAVNPPVYVPSLVFFGRPVVDDLVYMSTPLVSIRDLPLLVQTTGGGMIDPTLGGAFFRATDCGQTPASGVTALLDEVGLETRRFYFVNGLPSITSAATDVTGAGGFINVPTGVRSVRGTRAAEDLYFGTVSILVRPGVFSYIRLAPQPL